MNGALFDNEPLDYYFFFANKERRDANPIIPKAKMAKVDGSGTCEKR